MGQPVSRIFISALTHFFREPRGFTVPGLSMQRIPRFAFIILFLVGVFHSPRAFAEKPGFFFYDEADETIPVTLLENPLSYDAGLAAASNGLWVAWLEFQPGKGDQLWFGLRGTNGWIHKTQFTKNAGDYANPTPTIDAQGKLWLSYEGAGTNGQWDIFLQTAQESQPTFPVGINNNRGPNINHRVVADPKIGLWVTWQGGALEQRFGIFTCRVRLNDYPETLFGFSGWNPSSAVTTNGNLCSVWDCFDGDSYNVYFETITTEPNPKDKSPLQGLPFWRKRFYTIASSRAFEAHAQIASGKDGKLWVAWEEDGENWGQHYLARTPGDKKSTRMTDNVGPLHRFRKLHFAQLDEKNEKLIEYQIPQLSFDLANRRADAPFGLKNFGAFYEKTQLVVDGQDRPWIVYRHFYVPLVGIVPETHKQDNARIYARCLLPGGWSKLYSFSEGQGDGMQRISVSPKADGINLAWTTGRTDRRNPKSQNGGVALAEISLKDLKVKIPAKSESVSLSTNKSAAVLLKKRNRPSAEVAGKRYELFYGDLHRHTDISLCFSPSDGTIDDAYRYAIDAAPLDFLGITDHTHDLAMGDPLSLIWWRSRKEVNRHALGQKFIPFYSYERSRGDTDHNVISLRDDLLRPHTYPLTQFWDELDTNTFTIPHQPFNSILWNYKDNARRPLLEIYQGFRHDAKEDAANEGLMRGHEFGFIASSDHLSTGASFACVWTDNFSREGIFRAMQARRTFGATAKIILKVTCGEHWMGEKFSTKEMPPINIEVEGSDKIASVEIFVNGKSEKSFPGKFSKEKFVFTSEKLKRGQHIFYIRVRQSDGNLAWSSPIWVNIQP